MDSLPEINLVLENLDHQSNSPQTSPSDSPRMLAGKILSDRTFCTLNPSPTGWESSSTPLNLVNESGWGTWEEKPTNTNTGTILVKFDQPDPAPNRFHHFRTLFASQFLPLAGRDTTHMGMLESIYYSLKFAPYLKQEENYLGPAPYCDFKRLAQTQKTLWLAEHYALAKERIEKLRNHILNFNAESLEVMPGHADKKLQRCFKRKHPKKEAQLQREAKALVLGFRPLMEKKLESDAKEDMRKMELQFLQFD
ncbi:hypothetical protein RHMOL_Rhmol04G0232200 [Rhododendron molle]|uniref:Uncharacterized protein n=1 Tax=Rhododendron molle TaxID=49168 RepID=A0ACC0P4R2_RHOML|nr:hypothetical protein RHMOL_Rhmol04G0232200 [Rhododendron molle]